MILSEGLELLLGDWSVLLAIEYLKDIFFRNKTVIDSDFISIVHHSFPLLVIFIVFRVASCIVTGLFSTIFDQ